jgi:signal peptidase I
MTNVTEWLANMPIEYVVAVIVVLFAIRIALGRYKSPLAKSSSEMVESALMAIALVFLLIRPFIVQSFFIPSGSMRPTLEEQDHILVNKFVYRFKEPKRGDIVVFRAPADASPDMKEHDFIKRLIGEPGDTLEVKGGYVTIGGDEYDHNELRSALYDIATPDPYGPRVKIVRGGILLNGKKIGSKDIAAAVGRPGEKVVFHPGVVVLNHKALNEPYTAEDPESSFPETKVPKGKLFMMGDNRNNSSDSRVWGPLARDRVLGKAMFIFWPLNRIRLVR